MGCASVPTEQGNVQNWLDQQPSNRKLDIKVTKKMPKDNANITKLSHDTRLNLTNTPQLLLPALLKMYVKMGCSLGATACYDAEFDCADVFIWLPFEQVNPRYQHYLH